MEDLNPVLSDTALRELDNLADQCPSDAFPAIAAAVAKLLELYNNSTISNAGQAILQEYFQLLENSAKQLADAGVIKALPTPENNADERSLSAALVLYKTHDYSAIDHCKILTQAHVPEELCHAADAYRRRVEVVDTVFGVGFRVLHRMDVQRFQEWAADYLDSHTGQLTPEVIRDLIFTLRNEQQVSPRIAQWLAKWCGDAALLENWPLVTRYADRLLGRLALRQWGKTVSQPRNRAIAHLKLLIQQEQLDDQHLLTWLTNTLQNFGEGVERFIELVKDDATESWENAALIAELRTLASTYHPILLVADHLLNQPDGAAKLAMAFLGIIGKGLMEWEKRISILSEKIIRRAFLRDLGAGRTPVETIRQYTFGDDLAFNLIRNQLDLLSQQFDSIAQREVVVKRLAVYYASFRRAPMLGVEVAKRYRHLARTLHTDYLQNHLSSKELDEFQQQGFIQELYTMTSLAKRFLDHRRALEMSVEEMLASEIEFVAQVRKKRLEIIRNI